MCLLFVCRLVVVYRFLKLFAQQNWSAMVTRTLIGSMPALGRFFVIFLSVDFVFVCVGTIFYRSPSRCSSLRLCAHGYSGPQRLCWCFAGHLVFGEDSPAFAQVSVSFTTTLRYVAMGTEWEDLKYVQDYHGSCAALRSSLVDGPPRSLVPLVRLLGLTGTAPSGGCPMRFV